MANIELRYYQTSLGKQPFTEWMQGLKRAKAYFEDYKARSAKAKPPGRA